MNPVPASRMIVRCGVLLAVAFSGGVAAADEPVKASAFAELYTSLSKLQAVEKRPYDASEFVTNWIVRNPANEQVEIAMANPDVLGPGVRLHQSEFLIQFKPGTTPANLVEHLSRLKERYRAETVSAIPEIGVVLAKLDPDQLRRDADVAQDLANAVAPAELPNLRLVKGLEAVLTSLRAEPWVNVATPNVLLVGDTGVPPRSNGKGAAKSGLIYEWDLAGGHVPAARDGSWGLKRMGFPSAWKFCDAIHRRADPRVLVDGIHVGVIDVGFGDHLDLPAGTSPRFHYSGVVAARPLADHGNHVAGIVGAAWNGVGTDGCSPFVRLTACPVPSIPSDKDVQSPKIALVLVDVLATCTKFIQNHPDVRVINLSVGYNWVRNEGVDPNNDAALQQIVTEHGQLMRTLAELAERRRMLIVSAAGNDSRPGTLPAPVDARWSSPANWAAVNAMSPYTTPARNIIVVESAARDDTPIARSLSDFSDVHGCLSAPGEWILSAVATANPFRTAKDKPIPNNANYAPKSGTSMAAPHVTGLIALMYAYNPDLTPDRVLDILDVRINNRPSTLAAAPMVDAFDALIACRQDSWKDLADLNNDGAVNKIDFNLFKKQLRQAETRAGKGAPKGGSKPDDLESVYPRTDLNGDGRLSRADRRRIRDPRDPKVVRYEELSDLEVLMKVYEKQAPSDPEALDLPKHLDDPEDLH